MFKMLAIMHMIIVMKHDYSPWSRKVAWIRALVHRATKICSTQQLLQVEILNIKRFASWNGFPRWICDKLINNYSTSQSSETTPGGKEPEPTIPVIWIRLPFIGQKGNFLLRNCTRKISRLLKQPVKFMNHWETTECNCFTSQKDPTPKPYKSSIVYKFFCPGCNASYIGKTDRCLYTRVNTPGIFACENASLKCDTFCCNRASIWRAW